MSEKIMTILAEATGGKSYRAHKCRSVIYPVIVGQIGVGCCQRVNKCVKPIKFKPEFVLSIFDMADATGKRDGYGTCA